MQFFSRLGRAGQKTRRILAAVVATSGLAFAGCSAESEASFKTVAFLAKKVDELSLPVILTMEGAQHKIAETVRRTTKSKDQRILTLDSLQSTGLDPEATSHFYRMLHGINSSGIAVVMVSHDLDGALDIATHVLTLGANVSFRRRARHQASGKH